MRVTPISSINPIKFASRRPVPGSFSDLVEAMSKKSEVRKAI